MLINGCQEGKGTPRLTEVKCPKCGQYVEVFVLMGGPIGKTGTLAGDEICECGHILPAGSYEADYEQLVPGGCKWSQPSCIGQNRVVTYNNP